MVRFGQASRILQVAHVVVRLFCVGAFPVACGSSDGGTDSREIPIVDSFETGSKKEEGTSKSSRTGSETVTGPGVRYTGRTDSSRPNDVSAAWPASAALIRFRGTGVSLVLSSEPGYGSGPDYVDVFVDGTLRVAGPLEIPAAATPVTLATGLALGVHTVEVVKRTEARIGTIRFGSVSFPEGGELLEPPPAARRRVEIIGNSNVSGYGLDGHGPTCDGGNPSSSANATRSVAFLTARGLDAELSLLAYGGKGVATNATPGDTDTLPVLFNRLSPDKATRWTFGRFVPDAVVLAMSNLDADIADDARAQAYGSFTQSLREAYPNARILLVTSAYSSDSYPAGGRTRSRLIETSKQVVALRRAVGDTKIAWYAMAPYADGQLTGCDFHPNAQLHAQMSAELTGWLKGELAW